MINRVDQPNVSTEYTVKMPSEAKGTTEKTQSQKEGQRERKPSDKEIQAMTDGINDFLASANSQLKFVYHDGLNEYYVTLVDSATDEVIREIPSKKLMDIHAAMKEFVGLLVDRKI